MHCSSSYGAAYGCETISLCTACHDTANACSKHCVSRPLLCLIPSMYINLRITCPSSKSQAYSNHLLALQAVVVWLTAQPQVHWVSPRAKTRAANFFATGIGQCGSAASLAAARLGPEQDAGTHPFWKAGGALCSSPWVIVMHLVTTVPTTFARQSRLTCFAIELLCAPCISGCALVCLSSAVLLSAAGPGWLHDASCTI